MEWRMASSNMYFSDLLGFFALGEDVSGGQHHEVTVPGLVFGDHRSLGSFLGQRYVDVPLGVVEAERDVLDLGEVLALVPAHDVHVELFHHL